MKFSILIPAHNSEKYIRKALNSVKAQTFKDYELLVACDACTDKTAEIARKYTDKVFEVDYANEGPTRNFLLDHATGDWILWIDDDDWWMHEYVLEELSKRLTDSIDVLCFSFIFKGRGYAHPRSTGNPWPAVWTKCWRRSFIGSTRFGTEFPADWQFHRKMMQKNGRIQNADILVCYYNYLRAGSQSWEEKQGIRHFS